MSSILSFLVKHPQVKLGLTLLFWGLVLLYLALKSVDYFPAESSRIKWPELQTHPQPLHTKGSARQAQALFSDVLEKIESSYVDETLNHQRWSTWRKRYQSVIQNSEDAYVAIDSVIASLNDPYTRFFKPDEFAEQNLSISSKLYGIGVEITITNEAVTIINILPNSPAMASKSLALGDVITHIDGKPVAGLSLLDVAKRIRGKKGSALVLTVQTPEHESKTVKVLRDEIKVVHVQAQGLSQHPDVGYIKLQSFMGLGISNEFRHILEMQKNKPFLIIDLRNNGGGMLNNAVEIADFFVDDETIVTVEGRGHAYDTTLKGQEGTLYTGKIALLANQGSASASEVLAGALRDLNKAIIVGQTTYGKGLVQQIIPLQGETVGLNLTIARYLTPSGYDLNHVGLKPDVFVSETKIRQGIQQGEDVVLERAIETLKSTTTTATVPIKQPIQR
jgi:carboxyl-terminal processing protease